MTRTQLSRLLGVTDRVISHYTESGLIVPDVANPGQGKVRRYSARNALEVMIIRELAGCGLSLEDIRYVMTAPRLLGSDGFDPWDPECQARSDRRYFLAIYNHARPDGRLIVTGVEKGRDIPVLHPGSPMFPDGFSFSTCVIVDITTAREKLMGRLG